MYENNETPFETHLNSYRENGVDIPEYLENYLEWNYRGYINGHFLSDGYYTCTCGYKIPTPGHGIFVLVSNSYQIKKNQIMDFQDYGFVCPKCHKITDFLTPLEYIDVSNKIIIKGLIYDSDDRYMQIQNDEYNNHKKTKELRNNGYKFFVVRGREEMLKIIQNL